MFFKPEIYVIDLDGTTLDLPKKSQKISDKNQKMPLMMLNYLTKNKKFMTRLMMLNKLKKIVMTK